MGIFKSILGSKIKPGYEFNESYGPESLHELLVHAKIQGGSQTANLSDDDLKKFEKIIAKHAKYSRGKFSGYTKYRMRMEGHKLYNKNEISWEDLKDFKRIVNAL